MSTVNYLYLLYDHQHTSDMFPAISPNPNSNSSSRNTTYFSFCYKYPPCPPSFDPSSNIFHPYFILTLLVPSSSRDFFVLFCLTSYINLYFDHPDSLFPNFRISEFQDSPCCIQTKWITVLCHMCTWQNLKAPRRSIPDRPFGFSPLFLSLEFTNTVTNSNGRLDPHQLLDLF